MKISSFELFPVRVPYRVRERSSAVDTGGVSNILVKLGTDDGLIGWGESTSAASTETVVAALEAMAPWVLGRSPWDGETIAREVMTSGRWRYQAMTAAFAFTGIDIAMADLCGRASAQPLHRLLGGALRDRVSYFYYLQWDSDDGFAAQCRDGIARGYSVFYLKVGEDEATDEHRLAILRETIGPRARIRIDANQSWNASTACRLIERWHHRFVLDLVEGPIRHHPPAAMVELKRKVSVPLCADEGLRGEDHAFDIVSARCADVLCLSPYDVGSLRRMLTLAWYAERLGQQICKHTWGELGIYAAAMQHLLLALPNATDGHQQTAQLVSDDVLADAIPIATGAHWGLIHGSGLGVQVDDDKVGRYHEAYREFGEFRRERNQPGSTVSGIRAR